MEEETDNSVNFAKKGFQNGVKMAMVAILILAIFAGMFHLVSLTAIGTSGHFQEFLKWVRLPVAEFKIWQVILLLVYHAILCRD